MVLNFKTIPIEIRYRSNEHSFPRDFLVPVLRKTSVYKRAVGFFSTSALIELSYGLFDMAKNGGKIKLICSPRLSDEDIEAIQFGYKTKERAITEALELSLTKPLNYFEEERLNLIATMIANGMLEIKLAFMETDTYRNLYHEKIAILEDFEGNKISYTGSLNDSQNAFSDNFESIYTFCDWKDDSQKHAVKLSEYDFDSMWDNSTDKLKVIPFPEIILDKLSRFKKDVIDSSIDEQEFHYDEFIRSQTPFHIPEYVKLYPYQKDAISEWNKQDNKGVIDFCTGAGKTFTSLACMVNLAHSVENKLAVFIVCPYIHLVGQWEEDVIEWVHAPIIIAHSDSPDKKWKDHLVSSYKKFRNYQSPFVCITTIETFAGKEVQSIINRFTESQDVLLIVDEAHNVGTERLLNSLPKNIKYRIGLSATINRWMDQSGTDKLFEYFGNKCAVYDLTRAIKDGTLCKYDYFPIVVNLEDDELQVFQNLTERIKKCIIFEDGKTKLSKAGETLVFQRSRILAGARQKPDKLISMMSSMKDEKNILIYCGATSMENEETGEIIRQIDGITYRLSSELNMRVARFTAEEDLKTRQEIKRFFKDGLYQVVTAIKCLDEGVNIPGIQTAFILSSSKNPKEFIQRRGRLLRKGPGKTKAIIYDFITLPRPIEDVWYGDYENDKSVIDGELKRMYEFGRLAENRMVAESVMNRIMDAYDVILDFETTKENEGLEYE